MIFLGVLPKILKSAGHQTTARPGPRQATARPGQARPAGRPARAHLYWHARTIETLEKALGIVTDRVEARKVSFK